MPFGRNSALLDHRPHLFLLQAVSANPDLSDAISVPDGYTGTSLNIPRPSAGTIFFKLRDDPANIESAVLPMPAPPAVHAHHAVHSTHGDAEPSVQEPPTGAPPDTMKPAPPATVQPVPAPQK